MTKNKPEFVTTPRLRHCRWLTIYETSLHFYVIGTDPSETRYSTLKIDRSSESQLLISDPSHQYTKNEINELLSTISSSSIVTPSESWTRKTHNPGLIRTLDRAFGLLGAVRFLEGYYLLVVTKARVVARIGHHKIYKVEDISMIYIPSSGQSNNVEEQRYARLFQTVDVTTDFFFSYTYDLSRNLQENVLIHRNTEWNKNTYTRSTPHERKFVWNDYLLKPFKDNKIRKKWTLEIVHGYIGYQLVELPCAKLTIILIARRSAFYAGTRFLKRGCNFEGAAANEVETEQIVWDMNSSPSLETGRFVGHVQIRGSVPLFWSQDMATGGVVVGKPAIFVDLVEPHALTTARHFRDLRRKYGHPIVVMNLVKRRENRNNENLLHLQFLKTVRHLNEFRKPGKRIEYISFDVAKCNKSGQVMQKLELLGLKALQSHGWFQSFPQLMVHKMRPHPLLENYKPVYNEDQTLILQSGVVRANCVDCLDRTNVAQYGISRIALGFQLYALGYVDDPFIPSNSELLRSFEDLYDEHGDTIALQYAGSQLVHTIKTYKKISAFQERSRDVIQTISRYYSNTFNDYEKQNGINLFLGVFRPFDRHGLPHLWDIASDRYLHFPAVLSRRNEYLQWATDVTSDTEDEAEEWLDDWLQVKADETKIRISNDYAAPTDSSTHKRAGHQDPADLDIFDVAHRTFQLTSFDLLLREQEKTSKRPLQLVSLNQTFGQQNTFMKLFKANDSISSAQPSTNQSLDDEDDEEDEMPTEDVLKCEEEPNGPPYGFPTVPIFRPSSTSSAVNRLNLTTGLSSSSEVYGFNWDRKPSDADLAKYRKYVQLSGQYANPLTVVNDGSLQAFSRLQPIFEFTRSFYTTDSVFQTELAEIPTESMRIYEETVRNREVFEPSKLAREMYNRFRFNSVH
ncbi:Polyphosphoinositide phosphatase [Aphelenchoides besseyi]|nr:Polyphosphoinositide phosphatase [Aphelenchoides besseyi]